MRSVCNGQSLLTMRPIYSTWKSAKLHGHSIKPVYKCLMSFLDTLITASLLCVSITIFHKKLAFWFVFHTYLFTHLHVSFHKQAINTINNLRNELSCRNLHWKCYGIPFWSHRREPILKTQNHFKLAVKYEERFGLVVSSFWYFNGCFNSAAVASQSYHWGARRFIQCHRWNMFKPQNNNNADGITILINYTWNGNLTCSRTIIRSITRIFEKYVALG